jgi:Coenzyme PQQ synthesis protein D (PqqD)
LTIEPGQQFFKRSRSVVSQVIGGKTLIVPVRGKVGNLASIYSFSGTGSLIWQLLETPRALTELAGAVQREYGVRQEQAQTDVTQFVAEMFSAGLIEACPSAAMIATESNEPVEWETAGSR